MKHARLKHRWHFHLRLITAVFVLIVTLSVAGLSLYYVDRRQTPQIDTREYRRHSGYRGISTRVVQYSDAGRHYYLEYPRTGNDNIDRAVARWIDDAHELIPQRDPALEHLAPESVYASYMVRSASTEHISLISQLAVDRDTGTPTRQTSYWTFDRRSGQVITLEQLFGDKSVDGRERVVLYLRQALADQAKSRGRALDERALATIHAADMRNFLIVDRNTIEFDYDLWGIDTTLRLDTDRLQLYLQNNLARRLLDITPVVTSRATASPTSDRCIRTRCIALTFDDGPGPYTSHLLDVLRDRGAHASFFVVGNNVQLRSSLVKRAVSEGHTIGNHSLTHTSFTTMRPERLHHEISETNTLIQRATGGQPRYIRPPYGAVDADVVRTIGEQGMSVVLWSIDTRDWADRDADTIYRRVIASARPGGIVIMHDIQPTTVATIARIVDRLQAQGYNLVSLDEMLGDTEAGKIYTSL